MLRGIRTASANWLGRAVMALVMGLLAASFAIWGIGDIFRGFGRSTVAKVGGTEISIELFRQTFNNRLQQLSRQVGRPITMEQARQIGLDRQVLGQMIAEIVLDERTRALRLGLSDEEVAKRIATDPAFQGPTGKFDRSLFLQTIRQAGYTEARFVAEQRQQMLRRELAGTVTSGPTVPQAAVEAFNRFRNEQRSIDYVLLDRAQAGEIPSPTPEELAQYFDQHKILFRAPEYRKVTILPLIPSEQARWMNVSDEDARRYYEEHRDRYTTPERRHIEQIVFPNAAEAAAAADRIAKGASFADIAKERGLSEKDIDLGTLTKAAMIDKAVADAAFALKEGETSAPVQGRFGSAILYVDKIEPEQVRPYEQVAGEIKREIAAERAKAELATLYDKIEDARSEGKNLQEVAEALKLTSRTIEVDRSGRDPSGELVRDLPDAQQLLSAAFTTDTGVDNDPLRVQDGYVWYEVNSITPAHDRSLDEVKDKVAAHWEAEQIATRLKDKAKAIVDKVKAGSSLADVAAADHLEVKTLTGLKRGDEPAPLSASTVEAIFRTPKGEVSSSEAAPAGEQVVFRVTDVDVPTLDMNAEATKNLKDSLARSLTDDVFTEYLAQLQNEVGVSINQAAIRQVVTGQSSPDETD